MMQNPEGQAPPLSERQLSANELDTLGACQLLVPSREDDTFNVSSLGFGIHFSQAPRVNFSPVTSFL